MWVLLNCASTCHLLWLNVRFNSRLKFSCPLSMKHPVSINNSDNLALTTLLCDCFTSVQTMDYGRLDVVLIFEACETRKCVNVRVRLCWGARGVFHLPPDEDTRSEPQNPTRAGNWENCHSQFRLWVTYCTTELPSRNKYSSSRNSWVQLYRLYYKWKSAACESQNWGTQPTNWRYSTTFHSVDHFSRWQCM